MGIPDFTHDQSDLFDTETDNKSRKHKQEDNPMLIPRQKPPNLSLPLVGGGTFDLTAEGSERGTVVCFYRGLHCPICATYLKELESWLRP